jgi:hypothetical protein
VAVGLAVASKFSALPLLAIPLVAALLGLWRTYQTSHVTGEPVSARSQFAALTNVLLAWIVAFLAFSSPAPMPCSTGATLCRRRWWSRA